MFPLDSWRGISFCLPASFLLGSLAGGRSSTPCLRREKAGSGKREPLLPIPPGMGKGRDGGPSLARQSTRRRTMLPLWLLLAWPLLASSQEPEATCGPEGCYALYFQRRTFLEAWRSCREQGGNLATLKHSEEADEVVELLQSAKAGSGGESRQFFWIGLQRQPRQCFPQRPLRGFTWTTGDQDTSYTNWARPATSGASCATSRCVVLDDHEFQWLEGSCTLPVDGYVCRFAFQGMCPGLAEEGASVTYTTAFGPGDSTLRHVPFGTVAAVTCGGAVPAVSVLCMQKDDGTVAWSKDAPLCREHIYQHSWCEGDNGGCQQLCLDEGSGYSCECHAGYFLMPDGHSCAASDACQNQPCQFECVPEEDGGYHCRCPAGYELSSGEHQCEDTDECVEAPCEHQCDNTEGSFVCRCHLGFSPSEEEPGRCTDTDECQIPGVCQQMCVNYVGGFECYCTEGYDLDADGISCSPVAPLQPLPSAGSPRAGSFHLPFGVGHEWPHDTDPQLDHGLALSDHFPVFQDVSTASPDFLLPPPDVQWAPPLSATAPPLPGSPSSPVPTGLPGPAAPDPFPAASTSSPSAPMTDTLRNPSATNARSLALTTSPPLHPPALAESPGREEEAVAGGVRALLPTPPTPSPASGEDQVRWQRDDRWLLVALLVPICVFVVIMLALGIVYCTRCGAQAKTRSVTQCYRWVSSAGKGGSPPASGPCQTATCRTSV